jgi:Na+/proline symporter
MSVRRATRFLNNVLIVALVIVCAIVILAAVENVFHPFTAWLHDAKAWLIDTEKTLNKNSLMGISFGMVVLTLGACLGPMFMPRVNKQQYRTNTVRGVIASVVFFFTQLMYDWAENFGRLHLIGAMAAAIVVTVLVIEFLSLLTRVDEEVSFRTDLLASVASGLAAGIVIKLIEIIIIQLK